MSGIALPEIALAFEQVYIIYPYPHDSALLKEMNAIDAGSRVTMIRYFVCVKDVMTIKKDRIAFSHFMDRQGKTLIRPTFSHSLDDIPIEAEVLSVARKTRA